MRAPLRPRARASISPAGYRGCAEPGARRQSKDTVTRCEFCLFCCALWPCPLAACGSSDNTTTDMDTGATIVAGGNNRLTLGVNSYLWHATLDTLSFMPLPAPIPLAGW